MPMVRTLRILLALAALLAPNLASADEAKLNVIVSRSAEAIEVFVEARADQLGSIFGVDPASLRGLNTGIDYTILSDGTWDQGDAILAKTDVTVAGQTAPIEAMSMMVHPLAQRAPFLTPIDAAIAISVCGVEPPAVPPPLSELTVYVGYNIYPVDAFGPLALNLPLAATTTVNVRDFGQGGRLAAYEVQLNPGDTLTLSAPSGTPWIWVLLVWGVLAVNVVAIVGLTRAAQKPRARVEV